MAAEEYALKVLKTSVSQLCSVIGWTNAHVSALDVLTEITKRFILETGQHAHRYSEQFGRTQPTLEDLALAFEDMGVSVASLEEYSQNIQPIPPVHAVPQFPVTTQMQLNFMKPGSREVLTRPVHIQEYLPPMNPSLEEEQQQESFDADMNLTVDVPSTSPSRSNQLKRPGEPADSSGSKRLRVYGDEEQKVREITSVMMTTSGFISEAREGKLPEARLPMPFFDEEVVDVKPKKALPMKRIVEGVKKIEPVDMKKVKQEPTPEPSPSPAPPKKIKEKKLPKPEPVRVQPAEDVGYTVKPLKQPSPKPPKEPKPKPVEPEKPKPIEPEKPAVSKLNLFKKFLKGKEDKRPEEIDVETVREPPKADWTPSPPPRVHPPSPPPRTPSPLPAPGTPEKKKRKRKEKLKVKSEEIIESEGEIVEPEGSPPPRFDRNYPFVPPFPVAGDMKELPVGLKNLPPGLLGIRPGGVPSFPVRPVFPPPLPTPAPKERTPSPAPKSPALSSPGENLMTSPISDTHLSDMQSPTGRESPRKIKKEKKKKDKKLKSKDKEERIKEKEEKLRLKEEKKQKKEEKRALKKMREEKEAEEAEKLERQKEKEKEKEKEKVSDDSSLPKITFKFGSPPSIAEKSPTPEPPVQKIPAKPTKKEKEPKKEKEQPKKEKEPPKEVIAPKIEEPVITPPKKKERRKSPSKAIQEEPRKKSPPPAKAPTPKPPTPKPPTPKPPPAPKAAPPPKPSPKAAKKAAVPAPAPAPPPETPEPKKKAEKVAKTPKQKEVKKEKVSPKAEKTPKASGRKKQAEAPVIVESVGSYFDEEGNKIWICPTCGRQDDGTPMIGCDECDDWYHWVCVGIRVAPSESENWYCQRCLAKKKGMIPEKKKGKKKKGE